MGDIIEKVFEGLNIPCGYLKRPAGVFPYILYTYKEYDGEASDNTLESEEYDIYFNLFIKKDINKTTKKIKEALKLHGFRRVVINPPIIFENTDYYQVTFNYKKKILLREEKKNG